MTLFPRWLKKQAHPCALGTGKTGGSWDTNRLYDNVNTYFFVDQ